MKKSILIQAWTVNKSGDNYYLPYTHWVYLNEIVNYYNEICLLAPIKINENVEKERLVLINSFKNVTIMALPYSDSYISAVKHFFTYLKTYKKLKKFDVGYVRYPIPFGWLQKIFMRNSERIVHFVGDPIHTIKENPNLSSLKKLFLISFFIPEHLIYMWACRGANVFTNGFHITKRLKKYGVKATPLISSTLNAADFYFDKYKKVDKNNPKVVYVGYLRKAKGVDTVIDSFSTLQQKFQKAELTVVGSGESEQELQELIKSKGINNVNFVGHIDDRTTLNGILRSHDIFCFASLSEGSPRVILEAMANGINVVSTPVGSLPYVFKDNEDIVFADFNDEKMFGEKMVELIENDEKTFLIRKNAFAKTSKYTIENFLKEIFYEN